MCVAGRGQARRRVSPELIDSEVMPDAFNFNKLYDEKDMQRYQDSAPPKDPSKPRSPPFLPLPLLGLVVGAVDVVVAPGQTVPSNGCLGR
jgi:hypothetical protein